jgi:hypothetical protein
MIEGDGDDKSVTLTVDPAVWFELPDGTVADLSQLDYESTGQVVEIEFEAGEPGVVGILCGRMWRGTEPLCRCSVSIGSAGVCRRFRRERPVDPFECLDPVHRTLNVSGIEFEDESSGERFESFCPRRPERDHGRHSGETYLYTTWAATSRFLVRADKSK